MRRRSNILLQIPVCSEENIKWNLICFIGTLYLPCYCEITIQYRTGGISVRPGVAGILQILYKVPGFGGIFHILEYSSGEPAEVCDNFALQGI